MPLPFVSRESYELVRALLLDQTARYDALLAQYMAVTAPKPEPAPLTQPAFQSFPPAVAAALAKVCTGAPKDVARAVYQKARAMLDAGGQEADVAAAVLKGERVELAD